MIITATKTEVRSKRVLSTKLKQVIPQFTSLSKYYSDEEIFSLVLSAIRTNDFDVDSVQKTGRREIHSIDMGKIEEWIKKRLVPNTILITVEDKELLKLLVFSLAMPYKMLLGETRATQTEIMGGRTKKRDFLQIASDTFIGRIGEIAFKQFAKEKFRKDITLDWEIGKDLKTFESDIVGSTRVVSIKSTDTLESAWAFAPLNADYGISVLIALPKDFFMKILAHISSLKKLLNFVDEKIKEDEDAGIRDLVQFVEKTAYGEKMTIKAYVCGFFETGNETIVRKGETLDYLGDVYEEGHRVMISQLKYSEQDWNNFFKDIFSN